MTKGIIKHTIRIYAQTKSNLHGIVGIVPCRNYGRLHLLVKYGQDIYHIVSIPAEVVRARDEGNREQDGLHLQSSATLGTGVITRLLAMI
jgi:hypothetical protein